MIRPMNSITHIGERSRASRLRSGAAVLLLLGVAFPALAIEVCASAGKLDVPPGMKEPCESLARFAEVTGKCAAEIAEDRRLQRYAAGILELERQTRIDESVVRSLRMLRDKPDASGGRTIDADAFERQMAVQESAGERNRSALAAKRSAAVSAGYSQLAQPGYAQAVISNAVWRYLDNAVRPQLANCRSGSAGRTSAGEFAGMLAVSMSHGNPIETQIVRQLLGEQPRSP